MPRDCFRLRWAQASWAACLFLLGLASLGVLSVVGYCVVQRMAFPYELSTMEGCFADHARRVAAGKPIYAEPSAEFLALLYTPVSHYVAAFFMKLGADGFRAVRLTALLGIIGASLVGMWLAARTSRRSWMALMVPVLVAASYFDIDAYYDVGRPDNLMTLFYVLSVAALTLRSERLALVVFVLAALGLVYTKHSAAIMLVVLFPGVLLVRRALAVECAILLAAASAALFWWIDRATEGWFKTYVVEQTAGHSVTNEGLLRSINMDFLGSFALITATTVGSAGVLLMARIRRRRSNEGRSGRADETGRSFVLLLWGTVAAAVYSAASRWNVGGAANVLAPYAVMGAILLPVAVARAADGAGSVPRQALAWRVGLLVMLVAVLGGFAPVQMHVPTSSHVALWHGFRATLAAYGPPERIWVLRHGSAFGAGVDDPMGIHASAIADYLGGYFGPRRQTDWPADIVRRVQDRYYAAIVVGQVPLPDVDRLLERYYEPDPAQLEPFSLPCFSGWYKGPERVWIPRRRY
jgi:hypothetical protein